MTMCLRLLTAMCIAVLACMLGTPWATAQETQVSSESCLNCKHLRCLESLLAQRKALAAGYDSIATIPTIQVRDATGKSVDQVNTDGMPSELANAELAEIHSKLAVYIQAEDALKSRVPPSECGPPVSEDIAAQTNPVTCVIGDGLKAAQAAMPCKELADMIAAHERAHQLACVLRKHPGKNLPYLWLTPAGVAKEEAAAYRTEAATIQKMIDKLQQPRLESEAVTVEHFPTPLGTIRETVTGTYTLEVGEGPSPRVTGEGQVNNSWDLSGSGCTVTGGNGMGKVTLAGQISGGVLTLSITSMQNPTTQITLSCPPGFGYTPPVPKMPSKIQIPYQDGATVRKQPVSMPQVQVTSDITLHLKCKRPE